METNPHELRHWSAHNVLFEYVLDQKYTFFLVETFTFDPCSKVQIARMHKYTQGLFKKLRNSFSNAQSSNLNPTINF